MVYYVLGTEDVTEQNNSWNSYLREIYILEGKKSPHPQILKNICKKTLSMKGKNKAKEKT